VYLFGIFKQITCSISVVTRQKQVVVIANFIWKLIEQELNKDV